MLFKNQLKIKAAKKVELKSWINNQSSKKSLTLKMITNLSLLFLQILMMDFHILELLLQG